MQEAILSSFTMAKTTTGRNGNRVYAVPLLVELVRRRRESVSDRDERSVRRGESLPCVLERITECREHLKLLVNLPVVPDELANDGPRVPTRVAGFDEDGALETRCIDDGCGFVHRVTSVAGEFANPT